MVLNKEKLDNSKQEAAEGSISHEGFISYQKADLKSNFFVVVVSKRE